MQLSNMHLSGVHCTSYHGRRS